MDAVRRPGQAVVKENKLVSSFVQRFSAPATVPKSKLSTAFAPAPLGRDKWGKPIKAKVMEGALRTRLDPRGVTETDESESTSASLPSDT